MWLVLSKTILLSDESVITNEWMYEWMNECMNEWMNEWMSLTFCVAEPWVWRLRWWLFLSQYLHCRLLWPPLHCPLLHGCSTAFHVLELQIPGRWLLSHLDVLHNYAAFKQYACCCIKYVDFTHTYRLVTLWRSCWYKHETWTKYLDRPEAESEHIDLSIVSRLCRSINYDSVCLRLCPPGLRREEWLPLSWPQWQRHQMRTSSS